jgi:hypothetical protein
LIVQHALSELRRSPQFANKPKGLYRKWRLRHRHDNRQAGRDRPPWRRRQQASLTIPSFDLTLHVGPANALDTARALGIDDMWDNQSHRHELLGANLASIGETLVPNYFDSVLRLGEYPVTVLDQADAMASLAADTQRSPAHFVVNVLLDGRPVYSEQSGRTPLGLASGQMGDLSGTSLGQVKGIESASMVGTAPGQKGRSAAGARLDRRVLEQPRAGRVGRRPARWAHCEQGLPEPGRGAGGHLLRGDEFDLPVDGPEPKALPGGGPHRLTPPAGCDLTDMVRRRDRR